MPAHHCLRQFSSGRLILDVSLTVQINSTKRSLTLRLCLLSPGPAFFHVPWGLFAWMILYLKFLTCTLHMSEITQYSSLEEVTEVTLDLNSLKWSFQQTVLRVLYFNCSSSFFLSEECFCSLLKEEWPSKVSLIKDFRRFTWVLYEVVQSCSEAST